MLTERIGREHPLACVMSHALLHLQLNSAQLARASAATHQDLRFNTIMG